MSIYAKKGDIVTCESGCEMFVFIKEVFFGEAMDFPKQVRWINEDQKAPLIGDIIPPCKCGALFINYEGKFHFKDGWR